MTHVQVTPALFAWAVKRSGLDPSDVAMRFPKMDRWSRGRDMPTLRQLEAFARATRTPIGFFFLPSPPKETIPIPDFRTMGGRPARRASPDLLETIYLSQQRQEWYREYAISTGGQRLPFVGSLRLSSSVVSAADQMREALHFDLEERRKAPTWTDALRLFVERADAAGVLVMVNSIVGANTHRKLDPREFRGFAISDDLAPLIFVNGADSKSAQMFTLAHELAHLWLGRSALSDSSARSEPDHRVEQWCNRVAAELLVPLAMIRGEYRPSEPLDSEVQRLSRAYKVSTLVVLRRIHDAGGLQGKMYRQAYEEELERLLALPTGSGGEFYRLLRLRVGTRFARAVVAHTLEGNTLHRDAFRLLGITNPDALRKLGKTVGVG